VEAKIGTLRKEQEVNVLFQIDVYTFGQLTTAINPAAIVLEARLSR
jgi:hypothetical protein